MSRTEGINLPRLPTSHVRATSSNAVQHHSRSLVKRNAHNVTLSEPHYTAYVGTPRQDVPGQVYRDAAMFDDIFDRQGRLFTGRKTPKITSPLNTLEYNSLHDPHCRRLFLNNQALRDQLTSLGLLTDDLRVIATTKEQRQKIRGHELLERKEELVKKMNEREKKRINRLQLSTHLPSIYQGNMVKEEQRRIRWEEIHRKKEEKQKEQKKLILKKEAERKKEQKKKLKELLDHIEKVEQAKRNAAIYQQKQAELTVYQKQYGKNAIWHRESDRIQNRMVYLQHTKWSKSSQPLQRDWFSETRPQPRRSSSDHPSTTLETKESMSEINSESETETKDKRDNEGITEANNEEEIREKLSDERGGTKEGHSKKEEDLKMEEKNKEETKKGVNREGKEDKKEVEPQVMGKSDKESPRKEKEEVKKEERPEEGGVMEKQEPGDTEEKLRDSKPQNYSRAETMDTIQAEESSEEAVGEDIVSGAQEQTKPVMLGQEESAVEVTNLFFDVLSRFDSTRMGCIFFDQFCQIMSSQDLALPLDQEEILFLAGQLNLNGNGWIPLVEATTLLPSLLVNLFQNRLTQQIEQYGSCVEDRWLQLSSPNMGYIYLDKTTGLVQRGGRPLDYRPYLKDDWFEDVIVDFFEIADINRDGYVDQDEIYMFLQSPDVSSRVYTHQMDELYKLFLDQTVEGVMTLEQFVPFAHIILQMIYSNSYPNKEWVELESRKCGKYFFNPSTGETKLPDPSVKREKSSKVKSEKKRKESKSKEERKDSASKPPPLRKRSGKSTKSTEIDAVDTSNQSEDSIKLESVGSSYVTGTSSREGAESTEERTTQSLVEQVAERLQSGLNVIETIPEEEEEEQPLPLSNKEAGGTDKESVDDSDIDEVLQRVISERQKQD